MASEKSQPEAQFLQRGQVPIDEEEDDGVNTYPAPIIDPNVSEKRRLLVMVDPQPSEAVPPPPAYYPDSELPIPIPVLGLPAAPLPSSRPPQLRKPIAIPAIDATFDSPFLRAYPPILQAYNLPRTSFLSFLDGLNQVVASSPPLQVLDAAGGILKSVPILFPLHIVGAAVSGLANLSSLGVSKGRTERAIRQANKDIFGPRGLKLEVAKLDALAHMASIPILDSKGHVAPSFLPLTMGLDVNSSGSTNVHSLDPVQRQIRAFSPWIADLEVETLPWTSKSKLTRFNAAIKKRTGDSSSRPDDRIQADERQRKLVLASDNRDRKLLELDLEEQRARSRSREEDAAMLTRVLNSIAQDRSLVSRRYEEEVEKIDKEFSGMVQEEGALKKILWLVIGDISGEGAAAY